MSCESPGHCRPLPPPVNVVDVLCLPDLELPANDFDVSQLMTTN
jgi:hypothetical protein